MSFLKMLTANISSVTPYDIPSLLAVPTSEPSFCERAVDISIYLRLIINCKIASSIKLPFLAITSRAENCPGVEFYSNPTATTGYYAGFHDFFGLPIDPRGNIIGVLIAAWACARIEGMVRHFMPDDLDMLLTSLITLLITATLAYLIIMPLGGWLFEGMSWLFMHLNSNPLGCAVLAGLFLIAVVFGVHQGFIPVYLALMDSQGFNSLFPILSMAGAGQVGAALALYWRAQPHSALRSQVRGAIIPGLLGVGEPLIYGVTLPRMKPFITACLGGAAGGLFIGLIAWWGLPMGLNSAFGPSGLVALPLMTSAQGILPAMAVYAGGILVAWVCGFIFTTLFGCRNVNE